eukprot:157017_1
MATFSVSKSIVLFLCIIITTSQQCNVKDHGAKGDGKHDDTDSIENAIHSNQCNPVYFPIGTYRVGSMPLKDNKIYIMESGAKLVGDANLLPNEGSVTPLGSSVFTGNNLYNMTFYNIQIELIDASNNGSKSWGFYFTGCQKLQFYNTSVINPGVEGCLGIKFVSCGNIYIKNCIFEGHSGFECYSCRNVLVENTEIKGGDDALDLKGAGRNITFLNGKYWSTTCNAIILGSESMDKFVNISFINGIIPSAGKGGISIECMDGSEISNIYYSNISMSNVTTPIWIKIGDRNGCCGAGYIKNIIINNITAINTIGKRGNFTSTIVGLLYKNIGPNILLKNINFIYKGGGIKNSTYLCPYNIPNDFNPRGFGNRPSFGFDIQNVNN